MCTSVCISGPQSCTCILCVFLDMHMHVHMFCMYICVTMYFGIWMHVPTFFKCVHRFTCFRAFVHMSKCLGVHICVHMFRCVCMYPHVFSCVHVSLCVSMCFHVCFSPFYHVCACVHVFSPVHECGCSHVFSGMFACFRSVACCCYYRLGWP